MADEKMKSAKPSRVWRIVLVCSLGLNIAVAGVIGGSIVTGQFSNGPPRSFDLGLGPVASALLPSERRDVGRSLRQDRGLRGMDLRERADTMVATLKAEPFDPDAFRTLLEVQATQAADVQDGARTAFVAAITQMTPDRRGAFADQLADELSKERPRRLRGNSGG